MKIIYKDGTVAECPQEEAQHVLRHTAAHIMAQAIQHLYPDADFAYGPACHYEGTDPPAERLENFLRVKFDEAG